MDRNSIPPMKKRSSKRACFKNQSSERVRLKKRLTAFYKNSSWSFFFRMNSFTGSNFDTRIYTWSIFHWRDQNSAVLCKNLCPVLYENHSSILMYKFESHEEGAYAYSKEAKRLCLLVILYCVFVCFFPSVFYCSSAVGRKSHHPCFHVFLMETGVMTFVGHCTP